MHPLYSIIEARLQAMHAELVVLSDSPDKKLNLAIENVLGELTDALKETMYARMRDEEKKADELIRQRSEALGVEYVDPYQSLS